MKNKSSLTLAMIRDYVLDYYPNLLWWDGINKHETFNSAKGYKHRQGMANEIRIEFDSEDKEKNWINIMLTGKKLNDLKYSFAIFSVEGGRSPHIHIYDLDELEELDYDQRTQYRKRFLGKICPLLSIPDFELCEEKHLCALEFVNHFKYNKPKELIHYYWNGMNMGIDLDLKLEILQGKKKKISSKRTKGQDELKFGERLRLSVRERVMGHLTFEKVFDEYEISYKKSMALCPFHGDSDNSLSFSNEKKMWKCFGCGEKGDVITLIKKLEERNETT